MECSNNEDVALEGVDSGKLELLGCVRGDCLAALDGFGGGGELAPIALDCEALESCGFGDITRGGFGGG